MKKLIIALMIVVGFAGMAYALPHVASIYWDKPTENTNETPLTDLAGFKVYWMSPTDTEYTDARSIDIPDPMQTEVLKMDIPCLGRCRLVATAYNTAENESAFSEEITRFLGNVPKSPVNTR